MFSNAVEPSFASFAFLAFMAHRSADDKKFCLVKVF